MRRVVALIIPFVLVTGLLVGCGSSSTTVVIRHPHKSPGATTTTTTVQAPSSTSTSPAPSATGSVDCGGGLTAGSHTSCPFATNTRNAYEAAGGTGDQTVSVYSPVTSQTYSMSCTGSVPHVCTGANSASVYFP